MRIEIDGITNTTGKMMTCKAQEDMPAFEYLQEPWSFNGPVSLEAAYVNVSGVIEVTGKIKAQLIGQCSRCLDPMEILLEIDFQEEFALQKSDDAPERFTYKGNVLDLDEMIMQLVLLELPMQHLCQDQCKGLCQQCGANLNCGSCAC